MSNKYSELVNQKKILEEMVMNLQELKVSLVKAKPNNYVNYISIMEDFFKGINCHEVFCNSNDDYEKKEKTFNTWCEIMKISLGNQIEKINGELEKFERVKDGIEFLRCMKQKFIKNCDDGKEYAQFATGLRIAYMDIKQQNHRLNIKANDEAILGLLGDMEDWLEAFMDVKSGVD